LSETIANPYENFIALSRYARWLEDEGRRETWGETVDRYVNFMDDYARKSLDFTMTPELKNKVREYFFNRNAMPSMRAAMTAGPALTRDHVAGYNCSFIPVDSPRSFDEAMYILMCGTGVGFSVEYKYVDRLPVINEHFEKSSSTIVVDDSKQGWAKAVRELLALLWQGQIPSIDVTHVRPSGARLKTFGGRASGPQPLVDLFDFCIRTFRNAAGRKLRPIEAHDIMCKIGEVVVVGGVRRSALISLGDLDDFEMESAKSGNWWENNVQRALANNSAVYNSKPDAVRFLTEWTALVASGSGERGIFNLDVAKKETARHGRRDPFQIAGTNPCGEINLRPYEFCNLTEVVVRDGDSLEDLKDKVSIAVFLGTLQSTMTNFKYLRKIWRDNCEEERLLGVSLTGQFGHQLLSGSLGLDKLAAALDELREWSIEENKVWSEIFGINQSVAITTVKPSGTVSQLTGVSSGMHPWHSQYYLRSVRGDNKDPITRMMTDFGVPSEPDVTKPDSTTVFYFPIAAPKGAITRNDLTAIQHLEIWKVYKQHWTEHNPSITVNVKDHEWAEVGAWVYKNWDVVAGISFLPHSDHTYRQAPYQEITETEFHAWSAKMPKDILWEVLSAYESEDNTVGSQALACVSGECELVDLVASATV
jgi:ribonucleoside-triphosphate reductase (thioredoxin)